MAFERLPINCHDVSVEGLGRGYQPRVVFAHPACGATLQEGASPRLGQVQALNVEPLERRERPRLISRALEHLFYGDNRDREGTPAHRAQKPSRRALFDEVAVMFRAGPGPIRPAEPARTHRMVIVQNVNPRRYSGSRRPSDRSGLETPRIRAGGAEAWAQEVADVTLLGALVELVAGAGES